MNPTRQSLPGVVLLYWNDLVIRRAANVAVFGVLVTAGMYWVSLPVATPAPPIDNSFDVEMAKWASLGGIVLSALALLVLVARWMRVRKILTEGNLIKGLVEDLAVHTWTDSDSSSHTNRKRTRRSYYATLRYTVQGEERTVRLRIPNSGFVFGLVKGQETDVVVHDLMPDKPLICSIYRGRT